jgi:Cytochrome c554 and c-prime
MESFVINLSLALVGMLLTLDLYSTTVFAAPAAWLAFGDIRGNFEPCGCDPLTDLGGMQRLQAHLAREKAAHPNISVFNLGNAFSTVTSEQAQRKDIAIRAGMNAVAPDVTLLNRTELMAPDKLLSGMSYVLSNHKPNVTGKAEFKKMVETKGFLVFGIVEAFKGYPHLLPFDAKKWRQLKNKEPKFTTLKSVLLYSGSLNTLKKIASSKIFDSIISSNDSDLDKASAGEERKDPSRLIRFRQGDLEVLQTPAGAQGVLRSPEMERLPPTLPLTLALSATEAVKQMDCVVNPLSFPKSEVCVGTENLARHFVYWLAKADDDGMSKDMQQVVANFRDASSHQMETLISEREGNLKDSKYVGISACATCHSKAVEIWKTTKHSHAYQTLLDRKRTSDPECVSCHVVGFSEKGGFVSQEKSPHLADVQCEACHGARKDHALNPTVKSIAAVEHPAKKACLGCHTPPHSPGFDAKKYWEMIKH